ncbi:hypothetical protein LZ30DRAFT_608401, partial [Colletotrichum cereale]
SRPASFTFTPEILTAIARYVTQNSQGTRRRKLTQLVVIIYFWNKIVALLLYNPAVHPDLERLDPLPPSCLDQ